MTYSNRAVSVLCRYSDYFRMRGVGVHRRRIKTEEKAKVVAAARRTELVQFLAALAILHQDNLKNRKNCTRTIQKNRLNVSLL